MVSKERRLTILFQFLNSNPFDETSAEVGHVQMIYLHLSVTGRGVNKLIIPDIDSDMSIIPLPSKKDKIPFFQLVLFDLFAESELFPGGSGEMDIKDFIDLFNKSRTIYPF